VAIGVKDLGASRAARQARVRTTEEALREAARAAACASEDIFLLDHVATSDESRPTAPSIDERYRIGFEASVQLDPRYRRAKAKGMFERLKRKRNSALQAVGFWCADFYCCSGRAWEFFSLLQGVSTPLVQ